MTKKKVALVFGGSGGVGKEICRKLSADMTVYGTFLHKKTELENVTFLECDVSHEESVQDVVRKVVESEGALDCVVFAVSAGLKLLPFDKLRSADYLEDFTINALGGIHAINHALPYLKKSGGALVTILSQTTEGIPPARMASYVVSKYALKGFINCVRSELKDQAVRIITLSPSFIETSLLSAFPSKLLEIQKEKLPGKLFIAPADIANLTHKIIQDPGSFSHHDIILENREEVLSYL